MISIKNRKMLIPNEERYIGTNADNNSEVRTFRVDRYTQTEIDLSAFTAKADILHIGSGNIDRADLEMEVQDNYILLYLYITSGMVAYPGTILIDIKAFNDDGTVKWSSYKGAFYVEDPFTTPQATLENLTELEQLEARINRAIATANEKAIEAAEAWLDENVDPDTGYVIDRSLLVRGAAADAKTTGDAIAAETSARAAGDSNLSSSVNIEKAARITADSDLDSRISAEVAARRVADTSLQNQISQILTPSGEAPSAAEVQNIRVGVDGTVYSTAGDAVRGQINDLKNELNSSDERGKNLLYSAKWVEGGVSVTLNANSIVATALRSGSWLSAYADIDVSGMDHVFVSYYSVVGGNDKLRYGTVTNGTVSWVAFVNSARYMIDTSNINTIRIALYVTTSATVSEGATITYNKLQVENGQAFTGFSNIAYSAHDYTARESLNIMKNELDPSVEPGKNMLYSADWSEDVATVTVNADSIVVTALSSGTWLSAYTDIDVSGVDYIFVSYDSVVSGNDKIRYGTVSGETVSWVAFINAPRYRIDTSNINTLRLALYVATSTTASAGATIVYNKLQVEKGPLFTGFSGISYSACDLVARDILDEATGVHNLVYNTDRWVSSGASIAFDGNDIIVTSPESGTYKSVYIDIDVTGYDHVCISWKSISPSSTEKLRYGKNPNETGSGITWIAYITQTVTVIDTSDIDILRVALYVTTYASVSANTSVIFNGLQINAGTEPNTFAPHYMTAIDYKSRQLVDELAGFGAYTYSGEKIQLKAMEATRYFTFETWKDFTPSNTPGISGYKFYNNQSIAIFDNSLFAFQSDGGVVVFDLTTKEVVGTGTLPTTAYQHSNSAEFLDAYYNASDPFPILMNSRCGNSGTASGTTPREYDRAEFYRISASGSTYAFELINIVTLDVDSYGMTWSYDKGSRTIYATYPTKGNWSVANNETAFYGFRLSPAEILSGTPITLSTDDAIRYCIFDYLITVQGMNAFGGLLYCGVTQGALQANIRQRLYVIDPVAGRIGSDVVLQQNKETEGVSIHNDSIYVSFRDSTDTSSANPMIINRYEF